MFPGKPLSCRMLKGSFLAFLISLPRIGTMYAAVLPDPKGVSQMGSGQ